MITTSGPPAAEGPRKYRWSYGLGPWHSPQEGGQDVRSEKRQDGVWGKGCQEVTVTTVILAWVLHHGTGSTTSALC